MGRGTIPFWALWLFACSGGRPGTFEPDPGLLAIWGTRASGPVCHPAITHEGRSGMSACTFVPREVKAFGTIIPRDPSPDSAVCPIRVLTIDDHLVVEPLVYDQGFDSLPFMRCPAEFFPVARHIVKFDDGYLVSEVGIDRGHLLFTDPKGDNERRIARGRFVGFARTASGAILTLGVGRSHLGRGAVLRLDRPAGTWHAEVIAVLPVEPSTTALDDRGAIIGYGERFVFRVDENGRVENLHYVSRDLGHVASIARTSDGTLYLGVECGVLQVTTGGDEAWWSARDGASGQWTSCAR